METGSVARRSRALLVSGVVRDYNDNGDWMGFRVRDSYAEPPDAP